MQQTNQKMAEMQISGSPTIIDQWKRSGTAKDDATAIHAALWSMGLKKF